jgi:hypothetical protein
MADQPTPANETHSGMAVALRIALFLGGTIVLVLVAKFLFGV